MWALAEDMTKKEVIELAQDRALVTRELFDWNAFYGYGQEIKHYLNLGEQYQHKFVLEHGAGLSGKQIGPTERDAPLPAMLTMSSSRFPVLRQYTGKALFAIGSYLDYARCHLSEEELTRESQRLGRNLLVFPFHSTHFIEAHYNAEEFCAFIDRAARDFDSVTVCLYWKDILRGIGDVFWQRGYECVTAGHMFDPAFCRRLKSFLTLATATAANSVGTSFALSTAMAKPQYLFIQRLQRSADSRDILKRDLSINDRSWMESDYYKELIALFSRELRTDLTAAQRSFAERYCGLGETRSAAELRQIVDICEYMYQRGGEFRRGQEQLILRQALDFLNAGDNEQAEFLLNEALRMYPDIPQLHYGKALIHARGQRIGEALAELDLVLQGHPAHQKAKLLKRELKALEGNAH